jgi:hypothetical protein
MTMELHPRTQKVDAAQADIKIRINEIWRAEELTTLEVFAAVVEYQQQLLKYLLRTERHGDNPDGKGADDA